jgi:CubicO group peptidase (beta-lactamase class C family)
MMYPAGERFQYNNTGYVVLGLIIEAITGESFDEYLNKNIFAPCGMNDTGYYELDRLPDRCANAYIYDEMRGGYYTNIYSVDAKGTGAGGAFTTVYDILKFWNGLKNGVLISDKMFTNMITVHASCNNKYYGYGMWLEKDSSGNIVPHFEGCDPGVSFITSYDLNNGVCITAVSNFCCDVWKLRRDILKEISTSTNGNTTV